MADPVNGTSLRPPSSNYDAESPPESPRLPSPRRREPPKPRHGFLQQIKNIITGDSEAADELAGPKAEGRNAETMMQDMREKIKRKDATIAAQNNAFYSQTKDMQRKDDMIQQLRCRISDLEHDMGQHRRNQSRCRQAIEEYESQAVQLKSLLESSKRNEQRLESQIRDFQVRAFHNMNGDTWTSGDDGTVRQDLDNLQSRIKGWVRKHALDEMNSIGNLNPDKIEALSSQLTGVAVPAQILTYLKSPRMNKKSPAICLQALLTYCIYGMIVKSPFYLFGNANDSLQKVFNDMHSGKSQSHRTSSNTYDLTNIFSLPVDEKEAHLWRSKVVRLLTFPDTETSATGATGNSTLDIYRASRLQVCEDFVHNFLETPATCLIKTAKSDDQFSQVFESLNTVVKFAMEVSSRLWSRRSSLELRGLDSLSCTPFSAESDLMKAHAIHKLYDGDTECDGWRVGIVVHPAVVGFGNSDGTDYKAGRVWMKAEVVLLEPEKQADHDMVDWLTAA